ncbi:MAG: 3'-5' exonuclease [Burkholderiaceae bacterium]|nr:3'-5' exonuclease [Burkholderiaceae bacterium]MEB2320277.1 3'-5' exonuclease [Pseudomonadota bacterium]
MPRKAGEVPARWVVVDLETSGLNPRRDRLLAIGAVALRDARVVVDDSFEMLVRPRVASGRDNILIHGIGAEAQLSATGAASACTRFASYVGDCPLAAFHASFDQEVLLRAMRSSAGIRLRNPWLDIADLAPALLPSVGARSLDEWLEHFGIAPLRRHHATSDAFATATLFACLLDRVPPAERGAASLAAIARRVQAAREGG